MTCLAVLSVLLCKDYLGFRTKFFQTCPVSAESMLDFFSYGSYLFKKKSFAATQLNILT